MGVETSVTKCGKALIGAAIFAPFCGLIVTILPHGARAASFDCARADSERERLICSDAKLSEIDGELGRVYQERLALLSPKGAELLRGSQRSWLTYANRTCPMAAPRGGRQRDSTSCLRGRYEERVKDLAKAGQQIGPFRFNRVDIYSLKHADDEYGPAPGFFVSHIAYPQIDSPASKAALAWNRRQVRKETGGDCDEGGDGDIDFDIGYANGHFISLQWNNYSYCHGAAHGMFSSSVDNVKLQSDGVRDVTGQDIFRGSETAWAGPLQGLFWTAILAQGWKPSMPNIEELLKHEFTQPNRWRFAEDGLHFDFDAYEGGCYVCNPKPVTLSWDSLRPLLAAKAVVP